MPNELPEILLESTGYRVRRTAAATGALFEQALSSHDVTRAQYTLLMVLHDGEASTPLEIARSMDADAGSITRLADRLTGKGLILRRHSPTDRRSVELELTASGRRLVPALKRAARRCNQQYLRSISKADRERLFRILDTIRANCLEAIES